MSTLSISYRDAIVMHHWYLIDLAKMEGMARTKKWPLWHESLQIPTSNEDHDSVTSTQQDFINAIRENLN